MRLFYTPDIALSNVLPEEESRHAIKVLRLMEGDVIHCVNGSGSLFTCSISEIAGKRVAVDIIEEQSAYNPPVTDLHIAIAPTKNNDRLEWFLEKTTEIGISCITPIRCDRSERKILKPDRLNKILVAAMKQSLTAYKPVLNDMQDLETFLKNNTSGQRFIAHCNDPVHPLSSVVNPTEKTTILIGPEGDFNEKEIEMAVQNGFIPISLGPRRLRTETAGVVACHTVQLLATNGVHFVERS